MQTHSLWFWRKRLLLINITFHSDSWTLGNAQWWTPSPSSLALRHMPETPSTTSSASKLRPTLKDSEPSLRDGYSLSPLHSHLYISMCSIALWLSLCISDISYLAINCSPRLHSLHLCIPRIYKTHVRIIKVCWMTDWMLQWIHDGIYTANIMGKCIKI